jgi:hypothetical protein
MVKFAAERVPPCSTMAFGSEMPPLIANHGMDSPQNPDYTGAQSGRPC